MHYPCSRKTLCLAKIPNASQWYRAFRCCRFRQCQIVCSISFANLHLIYLASVPFPCLVFQKHHHAKQSRADTQRQSNKELKPNQNYSVHLPFTALRGCATNTKARHGHAGNKSKEQRKSRLLGYFFSDKAWIPFHKNIVCSCVWVQTLPPLVDGSGLEPATCPL